MVDTATESCRRSEIPAPCVIDGKVAWQDLDNQDDGDQSRIMIDGTSRKRCRQQVLWAPVLSTDTYLKLEQIIKEAGETLIVGYRYTVGL